VWHILAPFWVVILTHVSMFLQIAQDAPASKSKTGKLSGSESAKDNGTEGLYFGALIPRAHDF
jgi:hypothetical protein